MKSSHHYTATAESALCDGAIVYSYAASPCGGAQDVKREGNRVRRHPVALLVNENTVSAGEFLTLAVRDLGKAKLRATAPILQNGRRELRRPWQRVWSGRGRE